jgi:sporulation protein YlmC with PRC-barrel domain
MVSGKYFNKGVMALDAPHIGHVVRETDDKIVVFGGWSERYDIPISEIQTTGRNVLIGLNFHDIAKRYKVNRDAPLPTTRPINPWTFEKDVDLATYEGKYPNSLFNKGVRTNDEEHIGHVMKETDDKIVVFGHHNYRFDVPKSKIIAVGRNVILDMTYPEVFKYKVDIDAPLPTGEAIEKLVKEEEEKEKESLISSAKR